MHFDVLLPLLVAVLPECVCMGMEKKIKRARAKKYSPGFNALGTFHAFGVKRAH